MELPDSLSRYFRIIAFQRFREDQLQIDWEDSFPNLSSQRNTLEDHFWQAYQKQNPQVDLYNGTICQLRHFEWRDGTVVLKLGPVQFKSHLFSWLKGRTLVDALPDGAQLGLGVSAVVLSSDDRILFIKRSQSVAAAPGQFDVFGGHIDPQKHNTGTSSTPVPSPFRAIRTELMEELNLAGGDIETVVGMGLIVNQVTSQPELVFRCHTTVGAAEIIRKAEGAADHLEYSHIIHIPNQPDKLRQLCIKYAGDFSPSGLGSLWLHYLERKSHIAARPPDAT